MGNSHGYFQKTDNYEIISQYDAATYDPEPSMVVVFATLIIVIMIAITIAARYGFFVFLYTERVMNGVTNRKTIGQYVQIPLIICPSESYHLASPVLK